MISSPLVSVIMPIYNVDAFIEEAIDSVIKQSLGFVKNIELILVNDGSPDNSEKICLKYKERFPDNIVYIYQKNAGVSAARNRGLVAARGKYVQFLDPDDRISRNSFKESVKFLESNKRIDVVSVPIYFFGAMKGPHPNNNKFDGGTRIANMSSRTTTFIQSNVAMALFRRRALSGLRFDKHLKYGEDGKFVNEMLYSKPRIGLVSGAAYYYRKRGDGTSAVDGMLSDKSWYFDLINRYLLYIARKSKRRYGYVPRYVQNLILHDLRWRFEQKQIRPGVLSPSETREYKETVRKALNYVDDKVILDTPFIRKDLRIFMLKFKRKDGDLRKIDDVSSKDILDANSVHVDSINIDGEYITIEGRYSDILKGSTELVVTYGGVTLAVEERDLKSTYFTSMGEEYKKTKSFKVRLSKDAISNSKFLKISFELDGKKYDTETLFEYNSRLSNLNNSYRSIQDVLTSVKYLNGLPVMKFENKNRLRLLTKELHVSTRIIFRRDILSFGARLLGFAVRFVSRTILRKDIWILIDRPLTPTDNASSMFRYINSLKNKRVIPLMIVSKESSFYNEMKSIGTVVPYEGLRFRLLAFCSSVILSSHFDGFAHNPFGFERGRYMRIGLDTKFVYLQHGVLASDLSNLINKTRINSSLITVSSEKEKQSILRNEDYGYSEKEIAITGQARFDDLVDESANKNIIAFAPTWRFNLFLGPKDVDGKVIPGKNKFNNAFKDTEYYKYYNALINDVRILSAMKEESYTGIFCVHPQIAVQAGDFEGNSQVIVKSDFDYSEVLKEGSILVTDYSGIAFDFAYMKKPLLYSQFDKDKFYAIHTYDKGYFSFEDNGFGPVLYDYESTVDAIVNMIKTGPTMEDNYIERVEGFFNNIDRKNCERIYKSIIGLGRG